MNTQSLVDIVLALDKKSINYQVSFDPARALEFVGHADAYNGFTKDDLYKFINRINDLIPPMNFPLVNGFPNPNNGRTHHTFSIGNEGSRVIYLEIVKAYMKQFSSAEWISLWSAIQTAAKRANADEINLIENNDNTFKARFWWD